MFMQLFRIIASKWQLFICRVKLNRNLILSIYISNADLYGGSPKGTWHERQASRFNTRKKIQLKTLRIKSR